MAAPALTYRSEPLQGILKTRTSEMNSAKKRNLRIRGTSRKRWAKTVRFMCTPTNDKCEHCRTVRIRRSKGSAIRSPRYQGADQRPNTRFQPSCAVVLFSYKTRRFDWQSSSVGPSVYRSALPAIDSCSRNVWTYKKRITTHQHWK